MIWYFAHKIIRTNLIYWISFRTKFRFSHQNNSCVEIKFTFRHISTHRVSSNTSHNLFNCNTNSCLSLIPASTQHHCSLFHKRRWKYFLSLNYIETCYNIGSLCRHDCVQGHTHTHTDAHTSSAYLSMQYNYNPWTYNYTRAKYEAAVFICFFFVILLICPWVLFMLLLWLLLVTVFKLKEITLPNTWN